MKEELRRSLETLINDVPQYVCDGLLLVFCIGLALLLVIKKKKVWRGIVILFLVEYIFLIYCSTIIFREAKNVREYDYTPFWSYREIMKGKEVLLADNIMNVVVFVPVGILLGCAIKKMNWWKALMIGGGISFVIEFFQLMCKRGFSEVDDMMHNALGCMIGYGLFAIIEEIWLLQKRY